MAQRGNQLDQERFCCSICLDLLQDPVTLSCGHSYCMKCIKTHWDTEDEKMVYSCPQCRETFMSKPKLKKNTMLSDLVEELKKNEAAPAGDEDVACDVCTGRKRKSHKSCLVCLASYCEEHLQPHYQSPPLKKHELVEPDKNLQENICPRHNKVMDMFCRTDQQCICYLCSVDQHKDHDTVSAAAEKTQKQRELKLSLEEIQKRLQVSEVSRVGDVQEKLQQEITELKRREAEVKQLLVTDNPNQFLLNYRSLSALSPSTHSPSINVQPLMRHFEDVTAAVAKVRGQLQDTLTETWTNISQTETQVDVSLPEPEPKTRAEFLRYSQKITLDPNTVNKQLSLSEGNRKVTVMREEQSYPDHTDRFTHVCQVLSTESLTGCCYWEVKWRGLGAVTVAATYRNISRTGNLGESTFGLNDKSWVMHCFSKGCKFCHKDISIRVSEVLSSRVGVYLDHRAGLLSFYDISDTMTLLHRVQTTFTGPLYAGVWLSFRGTTAEFCKLN